MKRWIDLSAHGLKLKLAILPSAEVLVLENGDSNEAAARALGFMRRDTGTWVRPAGTDVNPREFIRVLPKAVIREMREEEYVIRAAPKEASKREEKPQEASPHPLRSSADAKLLGLNRFGQEVRQSPDGKRFIVDNRGRRTFEDQIATPMPGLFLRAIDAGSLALCAEGFIEQCIASEKHGRPEITAFAATVSERSLPLSTGDIAEALAAAAERSLVRKVDLSLRDRFGRAASLAKVMPETERLPLVIAIRRMLGNGTEMLGQAITFQGDNSSVISSLMPKGTRQASSISDADIAVDLGADVPSILARLSKRKASGRSIVALPGEITDIPEEIGRHYHVEAAARLTPEAGGPALVLSLGARKDEPGVNTASVSVLDGHGALWTWASDIALARGRLAEALKSGIVTDADFNAADPSLLKNDFQVPYASASRIGTPTTMVPKDLDGPTRQALDRVVETFGDIDHKVSIEFGFPAERLPEVLAPEQVDALGIYLHAEQRGRDAFLIADGAGVGKGRTLASIVKRSVMQGRKVIFFTEKELNLGDFQRDVVHIGADDIVKPYIMNDGASLIDERTGEEFAVGDRERLTSAVKAGIWPEGVEVIYTTYSQFNRTVEESDRVRWLGEVVDEGVQIVLDESHNGAGNSNVSDNLRKAISAAGSVVFSSATYAANAKAMGFYERIFPEGIGEDEIVAMMRKGGEEFQEVVSSMLVADGTMVRREQDLSQIEFVQVLDEQRVERNRDHMDQLAAVVTEMASLSGELDAWIESQNQQGADGVRRLQLSRMSFGSPLYTLNRLFSASLLSDLAAERAIEALRNGEKPVILTENTIEAILSDAETSDGTVPDFRAVVHRVLDQMLSVRTTDEIGEVDRFDVAVAENGFARAVDRIRGMIDALPSIPASAIDIVRSRIEDAGFSCGEITGRSLEIRDGKVVPRRNRNRIMVKNDFNAGRLDALIINVSGSTGVDMHAGRRFKDRRRRVMVELQGPSHVTRQIQAYFRVSRRDQESAPRIEMLSTGLPAETRLAAMRNQKLRKLSANVSSNRDSAFLARNIPDLLNKVGDTVISRYAQMRPDLMQRLHLDNGVDDETDQTAREGAEGEGTEHDNEYTANEFLARLMLLPTSAQEKILAELTSEYLAHVAELEAKGENPLRTREMEGVVHVRRSNLFEGATKLSGDTVFDGPLHLLDVMIERVADPISSDKVIEAVERGSAEYGRVAEATATIRENRDLFLEPFLPRRARTVDEAVAQGSRKVIGMARQMDLLAEVLEQIAPGRSIPMPYGSEGARAIITSIEAPHPGFEHMPSRYTVELAAPGATFLHRYRLDTLLQAPGIIASAAGEPLRLDVTEGLEGNDYDAVLEEFETAVATRMIPGRILTTNIFRAVRLAAEHRLGSLVSFVDTEGVRHRGVLVRKDFERKMEALALRVDGISAAMSALTELRAEICSAPGSTERGVLITPLTSDRWAVRLPPPSRRRGEDHWPSEEFRLLHEKGQTDQKGRSRVAIDGRETLLSILEMLAESGTSSYFASPKHRISMERFDSDDPARRVA